MNLMIMKPPRWEVAGRLPGGLVVATTHWRRSFVFCFRFVFFSLSSPLQKKNKNVSKKNIKITTTTTYKPGTGCVEQTLREELMRKKNQKQKRIEKNVRGTFMERAAIEQFQNADIKKKLSKNSVKLNVTSNLKSKCPKKHPKFK